MTATLRHLAKWFSPRALGDVSLAVACLCTACVVNPVPTPESTTASLAADDANGGTAGGGKSDNDAAGLAADSASSGDAIGGMDSVDAASGVVLTPFDVSPSSTDGAPVACLAAANPALPPDQLIVVLPDQGQSASAYSEFARVAAGNGARVVVLAWSNAMSANNVCAGDAACLTAAREELWTGKDTSAQIAVGDGGAIHTRLLHALTWLQKHAPDQNWAMLANQLDAGWDHVVIVGHGDGASQAAYIAKHEKLARVALLSGPLDGQGTLPSAWLSGQTATPASDWRALAHTADAAWPRISAGWTALGLGNSSAFLPIDGGQTPGTPSQLLTTSTAVTDPHQAVAVDIALPTDPQAAQHVRAAWKFLVWPY